MSNALIIAAIALAAGTVAASADTVTHSDRRETQPAHRIDERGQQGQLTWLEARGLGAQQTPVRALERRAKGDRRIDRHEARRTERAERAARRHITLERRDQERGDLWFRRWW